MPEGWLSCPDRSSKAAEYETNNGRPQGSTTMKTNHRIRIAAGEGAWGGGEGVERSMGGGKVSGGIGGGGEGVERSMGGGKVSERVQEVWRGCGEIHGRRGGTYIQKFRWNSRRLYFYQQPAEEVTAIAPSNDNPAVNQGSLTEQGVVYTCTLQLVMKMKTVLLVQADKEIGDQLEAP